MLNQPIEVMIGTWVWSGEDTSRTNQTQPQKPDPTEFAFQVKDHCEEWFAF